MFYWAKIMFSRRDLMMLTVDEITRALASDEAPFGSRLGTSLDSLDAMLGFRRSALVYQVQGAPPLLFAHARDLSVEAAFQEDMRRVQAILSTTSEKGIIRSALNSRKSIVLNEAAQDPRYVAADERSLSEACLVVELDEASSLALNVESSRFGVFSAHEVDFLSSIADQFALALWSNSPQVFDLQSSGIRWWAAERLGTAMQPTPAAVPKRQLH